MRDPKIKWMDTMIDLVDKWKVSAILNDSINDLKKSFTNYPGTRE